MTRHRWCALISAATIFAAATISIGSAAAGDFEVCTRDGGIAACSRAIASGKYSGTELANAYFSRGLDYQIKGDLDRAIADFTEVVRLDPKDATAYTKRGDAWRAKGDLDRAIADYTEAIRGGPGHDIALAYNNRGVAWADKGDLDRAIADYTDAIRLDPKFARAYYNRGFAKNRKGDTVGGDVDIATARGLQPGIE